MSGLSEKALQGSNRLGGCVAHCFHYERDMSCRKLGPDQKKISVCCRCAQRETPVSLGAVGVKWE